MIWKRIKEKFSDAVKDAVALNDYISNYASCDNCDVDVNIARHNYKMYQEDLNQRRQKLIEELIEKWCKKIREASRNGEKYIDTNQFVVSGDGDRILYLVDDDGWACDFPPNSSIHSSIQYFQEYFEKRGFNVIKQEYNPHGLCGLRISWLD